VKRLLRLLAVVAAGGLVMAGTASALAVAGSALVHESASAEELALPPLDSQLEEGSTVYADDGHTVLGVLKGPATRRPVQLDQVSKTMVTAVLDTEDHGFYQHGGFDVTSIIRALVNDAQGNALQGGSTIPQQLVKQIYLTPARTLSRKIREAVLADRLEQHYSKDRILQAYLNTIYLGNGNYGVQAAAEFYFHEPASALDLPQSALLAGMISDPNGDDPFLHAEAARQRRAFVLQRMVALHDITPAQAASADATPLPDVESVTLVPAHPQNYYLLAVENFLLYSTDALGTTYAQRYQTLFNGGLSIYTNDDPTLQAEAEAAVAKDTPANTGGFIEGLVAIDPANGAVRALVGGPSATADQFDVMSQGERQPGSGFKLFTLLTALEQGYSVYDSVDGAGPCAIKFPGTNALLKTPIRNDVPGEGVVSVVTATADSINCAFIRIAHQVGINNVLTTAYQLGISPSEVPAAQADYEPSVIIGADAVKPIEMAGAYAAVAGGGIFHPPSYIDRIVDRDGAVIYNGLSPGTRVIPPSVVAEADVALRAVVTSGTGTNAALYNRPVAGKTGTTNNNVDAWFNGFTPQLETTVWMGNFNGEVPIYIPRFGYVYGANFPAETWHDFMAAALESQPVEQFPAVDYATLPASRYITSPSLVADDVTFHNGVYSNACSYPDQAGPYPGSCPGGGAAPTYGGGGAGTGGASSPTTVGSSPSTTEAGPPATSPSVPPTTTSTTSPATTPVTPPAGGGPTPGGSG
jgi:membrane peptidoglycan carboxypeptidase